MSYERACMAIQSKINDSAYFDSDEQVDATSDSKEQVDGISDSDERVDAESEAKANLDFLKKN